MAIFNRRTFITTMAAGAAGMGITTRAAGGPIIRQEDIPVIISTWQHGMPANEAAWDILSKGGYALDAVEAGARQAEADGEVMTVGYGGYPDAEGKVTLDACVMNEKGAAGSVSFLQDIKHAVSVARLVKEKTPHVMLSGKGAQRFAIQQGFKKEKLLTSEMRRLWREQKRNKQTDFDPNINHPFENHDTISLLAIDSQGRLCGACTTSGLAYKMHGRVGDSPIIGAGLFVDGEIGGAAATGTGELVMRTLGSFLVVEFMRQGMTPEAACNAAIERIVEKVEGHENHQIGYIALSKSGEVGAASLQPGFEYAVKSAAGTRLEEAGAWFKRL